MRKGRKNEISVAYGRDETTAGRERSGKAWLGLQRELASKT